MRMVDFGSENMSYYLYLLTKYHPRSSTALTNQPCPVAHVLPQRAPTAEFSSIRGHGSWAEDWMESRGIQK